MRVAIVFPPSLCLPNQLYFSLPVLAGALKQAGHQPQITDLNLMAADRFLDEDRTQRIFRQACEQVISLFKNGLKDQANALTNSLDLMESTLLQGPRSKGVLRDPDRFYDQTQFRESFWNVVDCLGFFYQLDPVYTPYRDTFVRDMVSYQTVDPWTPLQDLYEDDLLDAVLGRDPEMLALSVAFPEQSAEALRFARRVRARAPHIHIALGGPLITSHQQKWLVDDWVFDYVDTVCVGDGEHTIAQLADALEGRGGLEDVQNLIWRDGRGKVHRNDEQPQLVRFDEIPLPDFDSADMSLSLLPEPIWPLMLSRGCYWGRCTFCQIGWRENYRQAAEDKIRTDIVDLVKRYGARYVQLQDSSIPPAAARALSQAIQDEGLDVTWVSGMKFESCHLDKSYCQHLADGGCRSLLMGFETANQRLLDLMDKGVRIDDVPTMLRNLRESGISSEMLWFTGFPSETRAESLHTMRFLEEHKHSYGLSAFVAEYQLHPDTIIYDRPADFDVTILAEENGSCHYTTTSGMQQDELEFLERAMAGSNNRTLVCNGSHLPHVAEKGIPYVGLARELLVPEEVREFCERRGAFAEDRTQEAARPTVKLTPPPEEVAPRDAAPSPRTCFLDDDFGFRSQLEAHWRDVLEECRLVPEELLRPWPQEGAVTGQWGIFGLHLAGRPVTVNRERCPRTAALLDGIPGIYTAGFSILGPHTMLPLHYGEAEHVLRCHLALEVPPRCGLRVGGEERRWEPGRTLVFEDTMLHRAWNGSDQRKVVLLIDFLKPETPAGLDLDLWHGRELAYFQKLFPDWVA
jgi:hypothetical protein